MQYRLDARAGRELSVLGMGCMRFPAGYDAAEKVVLDAVARGVNYFDTAYLYPGSEDTLGRIVEANGLRDRVCIATKLPHGRVKRIEDAERLFTTSLERLRTDSIDYYLIHNITSAGQWQRLVELGIEDWVAAKRKSGAIGQFGFSFHGDIAEFRLMMDAYDWDFVQIQYNYVNEHYQAGREGLELAEGRGIPVIVMEPLLGGRLAGGLPPQAAEVLQKAAPGRSQAAWGLRWLFDQPGVTVVLSGMNALDQLEDNCAAAEMAPGSMTADEREAIALAKAAFEQSFKVPCTGCNYCMPCPKGVSIPSCFSAYNTSFSLGWRTGFMNYLTTVGAGSATPHLASDCVACGACVKKCPQGIDIPGELRAVRKRFEFPGLRLGMSVARKIM